MRWFKKASDTLLTVLDNDASTNAWTFHPPHTTGFWQRRRCLEAFLHRWASVFFSSPDTLVSSCRPRSAAWGLQRQPQVDAVAGVIEAAAGDLLDPGQALAQCVDVDVEVICGLLPFAA